MRSDHGAHTTSAQTTKTSERRSATRHPPPLGSSAIHATTAGRNVIGAGLSISSAPKARPETASPAPLRPRASRTSRKPVVPKATRVVSHTTAIAYWIAIG